MITCPDQPHGHSKADLETAVKVFEKSTMGDTKIHAKGPGISLASFDKAIHEAKEAVSKADELIDEISYTWEVESKGARGEDVPARRKEVLGQLEDAMEILRILTHQLDFVVDRGV